MCMCSPACAAVLLEVLKRGSVGAPLAARSVRPVSAILRRRHRRRERRSVVEALAARLPKARPAGRVRDQRRLFGLQSLRAADRCRAAASRRLSRSRAAPGGDVPSGPCGRELEPLDPAVESRAAGDAPISASDRLPGPAGASAASRSCRAHGLSADENGAPKSPAPAMTERHEISATPRDTSARRAPSSRDFRGTP